MQPFNQPNQQVSALTSKSQPTIALLLENHAQANENLRNVIHRLEDVLTRLGHVEPPQPNGTSGVAAVPNGVVGIMQVQVQGTEGYAQELHRILDSIGEYL